MADARASDTGGNERQLVDLVCPAIAESLKLFIHGPEDQFVSSTLRETGVWEPFETDLVLQRLAPGDVFLDIGANIGYFSVLAASRVGQHGQVFCFEPDPNNAALLAASIEVNKLQVQTTIVQAGLADENQPGRLHLSDSNFGDHQIYADEDSRESLDIRLLKGADYLPGRTERVDLIKIDVQGAEFKAMLGLMPFLMGLDEKPDILLELTPYSLLQAGSRGSQLITLLEDLQQEFLIVDHIEHQLVPTTALELRRWCDNVDSCAGDRGFMNILLSSNSDSEHKR